MAETPKVKVNVSDFLADALEADDRLRKRPQREVRFHPKRLWRFDLCYPKQRLAIEIDGTCHLSKPNQKNDAEKRNAAVELGWRVLVYPAQTVFTKCRLPLIVDQIARVLCNHSEPRESARVITGSFR